MATKEGKQWWDPYETSNRRHFVHWPNPAAEILQCPTSAPFLDSSSQSEPLGSTMYSKEFSWKPACKPECIRTGTASGRRRNNPQPSQSFMMWRLPRDATWSPEYVGVPWKCPRSEEEIHEALTAQYSSIYRCDYLGVPPGRDCINKGGRRLLPLHSRREMQLSTDTEMRDNYRRPTLNPALLDNYRHTDPTTACGGIVPTVVKRHSEQKRSNLTNYDRFCGKRVADITRVMKSMLPQELQQLQQVLPRGGKGGYKNCG